MWQRGQKGCALVGCSSFCCSARSWESRRIRCISSCCSAPDNGLPASAIRRSSAPNRVSTTSLVSYLPSTCLFSRYFHRPSRSPARFSSLWITVLTSSNGEIVVLTCDFTDRPRKKCSRTTRGSNGTVARTRTLLSVALNLIGVYATTSPDLLAPLRLT
jgi:hypothetical protein